MTRWFLTALPDPYPHNIFLTSWTESATLGTGSALAMVLVHGLVDSPHRKNDLSLEIWILATLTTVPVRTAHKSSRRA